MSRSNLPFLLASEDGIFAFSKPAGMSVHPNAESDDLDFLSWVKSQDEFPEDLALVHRLDRGTSGVVLMAKGSKRCAEVGAWFADGQVSKQYLALVFGATRPKGIIRKKLNDQRRKKPLVAVTRYRRKEVLGRFSLLVLRPETGRKHQLRRHLQMIGHCIVGDPRYRAKRRRTVLGYPDRMWLHALSVTLPNGMSFECPLPPELLEHLELLRKHSVQAEEATSSSGSLTEPSADTAAGISEKLPSV